MEAPSDRLLDPFFWIAVVSGSAAVLAAWYARSSIQIAQRQDARKRPRIVTYLADGYVRLGDTHRLYGLSISISNPADSDNSIAHIELQVRYKTAEGILTTIRMPYEDALRHDLGNPDLSMLALPLRIPAHDTKAGWLTFGIAYELIGDAEIQEYMLLLTDAHGEIVELQPGIFRELADEPAQDED